MKHQKMYCPFCSNHEKITVDFFESEYDYELNCPNCGKFYIAHLLDIGERKGFLKREPQSIDWRNIP